MEFYLSGVFIQFESLLQWHMPNNLSELLFFPLLPPLGHAQDLNHPYENVQEIKFEAYAFVYHILPYQPPF